MVLSSTNEPCIWLRKGKKPLWGPSPLINWWLSSEEACLSYEIRNAHTLHTRDAHERSNESRRLSEIRWIWCIENRRPALSVSNHLLLLPYLLASKVLSGTFRFFIVCPDFISDTEVATPIDMTTDLSSIFMHNWLRWSMNLSLLSSLDACSDWKI